MTAPAFGAAGAFRLAGPDCTVTGDGVREHLDPGLAHGPGAAGAALAMLRRVEAETGRRSIVVGAIGFDPYRPARLWIPEEFTHAEPVRRSRRALSGVAEVPDDPHYRRAVDTALERIEAGELSKVVLARAVDVRTQAAVDQTALYEVLAAANPAAYAFGVDLGEHGTMLGASPELVVRVDGRSVVSTPLAGSAPRGADRGSDLRARDGLARSAKDLREHGIVVERVDAALGPLTSALEVPAAPSLSATEQLWHLSTTLSGRLRPGVTALDAAYALHPTPAVCGFPGITASRLIRELEGTDRGFFAGLVGWMDAEGNGEWVLSLRCGLVRDDEVRVHAGAGVVADSTAAGEHAETATKLQTFLRSLLAVSGDVETVPAADTLAVSGA